jgi:hypothetical protein
MITSLQAGIIFLAFIGWVSITMWGISWWFKLLDEAKEKDKRIEFSSVITGSVSLAKG